MESGVGIIRRTDLFHRFFEIQPSQILAKYYSKSILFHGTAANFASTSVRYSIRKLNKVLPVFLKVDFQIELWSKYRIRYGFIL